MQMAHWLQSQHPVWNKPIVVDMPKSIDAIITLLAVQLTGNIYVPVDPESPPKRKQAIYKTLGPCVTAQRESQSGKIKFDGEVYNVPEEISEEDFLARETALLNGLGKRGTQDPLYIIFTSGTTGQPKGVTISNANVVDYIEWAVATYAITEREVIGNQAPLFFDNSTLDLYLMLKTGATLSLIPRETLSFPSLLGEYLKKEKISFLFWVPSLLANLVKFDTFSGQHLSALEKILFAGEAMPLGVLKSLRNSFPNALLSNLYGPTEITVDAIYWIFGDELATLKATPLGIPCTNHRILFLDEEGQPIDKLDTVGEICVAGAGVGLGYWNDAERSGRVFIQNPENDLYNERIYKTGDLGYLSGADGLIYMVGRNDDQFKHLGYRIESGEIETALEQMPGIAQSCVIYDKDKNEILAFYTADSNSAGPPNRKVMAESLPPYMFPRRFILLENFPTTANGKKDRAVVWNQYKNQDQR